jgi:hypothetical protein
MTAHMATVAVVGVESAAARRFVVNSPVWADQREAFLALEDALTEVLTQSADE